MSSIPVYNHRPMQPSVTRSNTVTFSIVDSLDTIKHEYQSIQAELIKVRSERDDLELKLESQVTELVSIRRSLFELETQHERANNHYEEEIKRLRSDLVAVRQSGPTPVPTLGIPGRSPRPSGPLLSTPIMAEVTQSSNTIPRDRAPNDRELDMPEREVREKSKDTAERDLDRVIDQRDAKRHKTRRDYSGPHHSPRDLGSQSSSSFNNSLGLYRLPPNSASSSSSQPPPINFSPATTMADELKLQHLSSEYVKDGGDWCAVYNPQVKKALDINLVHTFVHTTVVCCVQFSADGRYLATGCNRTTQIFDVQTGAKVCVIADESAPKSADLYIRSVRFSPDGKLIATGAEDHKIRVWEIAKKRLRHVFEGHEQEIYSLDFSNDGRFIVSGSGDKTMRIWDLSDKSCRMITIETSGPVVNQDAAGVTSVSISPDGTMVAAGSLDSIIRIWEVASGTLLDSLRGHRDSVYSVAFTPDGKGIVSGSLDKCLKLWDLSSLLHKLAARNKQDSLSGSSSSSRPSSSTSTTPVVDYMGHKDFVLSVSASIDNRWLISGSKDRCVHFWDTQTNSLQFVLQGHKNSVISLDTNPLGGMIATGSGDNTARIWTFSPI
ncbi:WD40 repeat-like protein [Phlegmacium glaucopus]|nr:WD40 repeat-like protein [Phlegmacium glaucopus]